MYFWSVEEAGLGREWMTSVSLRGRFRTARLSLVQSRWQIWQHWASNLTATVKPWLFDRFCQWTTNQSKCVTPASTPCTSDSARNAWQQTFQIRLNVARGGFADKSSTFKLCWRFLHRMFASRRRRMQMCSPSFRFRQPDCTLVDCRHCPMMDATGSSGF